MAIEGEIKALLAPLASGGCYPVRAPQNRPTPYIIFQVISSVPDVSLDGPTGLVRRRVQVDAYGDTYEAVKTMEQQISAAMAGAAFTNVPLMARDLDEQETKKYRVSMDFSIWS